MKATDLDTLLAALPSWVLVGGKGGVGKTTCAAAIAARSAAFGDRTMLLSTDPARSLGDAIGQEITHEPRAIAGRPHLHALQLDAARARDDFLARWRDTLVTIVDRGTYLERDDVTGLVDSTLPGADEAMALLTLAALERSGEWDRVVVDTAPTGHTLRLLALPATFRAMVDLLDTMQGKHRFMVGALTHRYRDDEADRFLVEMRGQLDTLHSTLADSERTGMILVTRAEPMVVAETVRYAASLDELNIDLRALVVNALPATPGPAEQEALARLAGVAPDVRHYHVPLLESPPIGLGAIEQWGRSLRAAASRAARRKMAHAAPPPESGVPVEGGTRRSRDRLMLVRALTIVGGKGGVGKTTAACALGIATASSDASVLVVSTDPAPSVADALDQDVGAVVVPVDGVQGLFAQQMDATRAFEEMRERYAARIDDLFDAVTGGGGGMDVAHDRRVMRDLLALAPPGIDELHALSSLGATLAESRFTNIIVDPAPTGHLLRLLEMPALALEWSHRLMRLLLRYRDVAGEGMASAGEELLGFARRARAVGDLLADSSKAGVIVVALDEPLVRAETARLIRSVRAHGMDVAGLLWNRAGPDVAPLPVTPPLPQFACARTEPPPLGIAALSEWHGGWSSLES